MPTLYDITEGLKQIDDQLMEGSEDVEPGELTPELEAALDSLEGAFDEKVENIVRLIRDKKVMAGAIGEEIDRLQKRKQSQANAEKHLRRFLLGSFFRLEKTKLKTAIATVSVTKGRERLVVDNEKELPGDCFIPQPPKLDRKKVTEILKDRSAPTMAGAHLETGDPTLTIR